MAELLLIVRAANQGHRFKASETSQLLGVRSNLHDQLSRRRNDHRTRLAEVTLTLNRMTEQIIEDRDEKGSGFTGTGLRLTNRVVTRQGMGQNAPLNRRAELESQGIDTLLH